MHELVVAGLIEMLSGGSSTDLHLLPEVSTSEAQV